MASQRRVFVLGAGASRVCGLPLTKDLFPVILKSPESEPLSDRLNAFLVYLYPTFRPKWRNYPSFEEFLSLLEVYLDWAPTVKRKHLFSLDSITQLKQVVLRAVSRALIERLKSIDISSTPLFDLVTELQKGDVVITFNWDLTMERAIHESKKEDALSFQLRDDRITLLKPHGSVDWFDRRDVKLKPSIVKNLMPDIPKKRIQVFQRFRLPNIDPQIAPAIVAPTIQKTSRGSTADRPPEFDILWRDAWRALRSADAVHFVGYSLPPEDLHVTFILRSALRANERDREGDLRLTLVNPDRSVTSRVARLVRSPVRHFDCGLEHVSLTELLTGRLPPVRARLVK